MTTTTNHHYREFLSAFELSKKELEDFDYLEQGEGNFIKYRGRVWEMGEFQITSLSGWDAICADCAFGGTVIKLSPDCQAVKVGYVYE